MSLNVNMIYFSRTKGNEPMYMAPGTAYVYFTYGMYHCFNISSDGPGAAVLLRAVEPLLGMEKMQDHRKTGIYILLNY